MIKISFDDCVAGNLNDAAPSDKGKRPIIIYAHNVVDHVQVPTSCAIKVTLHSPFFNAKGPNYSARCRREFRSLAVPTPLA
jgi:hypothetical protein